MANGDWSRVRVDILGTEYTLRGQVGAEHLRSVSRLVDDMMTQISSANPHLDPKRVAVLAAVNLADELLRLRQDHQSLLSLLDEQTKTPPTPSR